MDYLIALIVVLIAWVLFRRSQDRAFAEKLKREKLEAWENAQAVEREAKRTAEVAKSTLLAKLSTYSEPVYSVSSDPVLAQWERSSILDEVGPWKEFLPDMDAALEPYVAAGSALTKDLKLAIIADARERSYLEEVGRAKEQARRRLDATRAEEIAERRDEDEAKKRLAEFVARQKDRQ